MNKQAKTIPVTLVTTCKPFRGTDAIYQENAIASWKSLNFEVLIVGDDDGCDLIAQKHKCTHIPTVETGPNNLPLISDIFKIAEEKTSTNFYAYINSDIILEENSVTTIESFLKTETSCNAFLLTARRQNIPIIQSINFYEAQSRLHVDSIRKQYGTWDHPYAIDFFLVNKGWLKNIPPIVVGRAGWDNWMLKNARANNVNIIDSSNCLRLLHPLHGYNAVSNIDNRMNAESLYNKNIIGDTTNNISNSCTHTFDGQHITKSNPSETAQEISDYSVDIEKLFTAEIIAIGGQQLNTPASKVDYLYAVLSRSLHYFSHVMKKRADENETDKIINLIARHSHNGDNIAAIQHLQDWLGKEFIDAVKGHASTDKDIYIWGAGAAGKRLCSFLLRHNIEIAGFLSSQVGNDDPHIYCKDKSFQIFETKTIVQDTVIKPFIILASMDHHAMAESLKAKGYRLKRDFLF